MAYSSCAVIRNGRNRRPCACSVSISWPLSRRSVKPRGGGLAIAWQYHRAAWWHSCMVVVVWWWWAVVVVVASLCNCVCASSALFVSCENYTVRRSHKKWTAFCEQMALLAAHCEPLVNKSIQHPLSTSKYVLHFNCKHCTVSIYIFIVRRQECLLNVYYLIMYCYYGFSNSLRLYQVFTEKKQHEPTTNDTYQETSRQTSSR